MVGRGGGRVPERWTQYSPLGHRLPGTRFIAFKVPLSKRFEQQLLPEQRFSPQDLLRELQDRSQELGLIIDLTCTTRYYGQQELPPTLLYCKLMTMGREIPDSKTTRSFQSLVGEFLRENQHNDKLIGVHCTHGLNRTGYLVCRYLIDVEGMEPNAAIELFNESRGHPMERINYIQDLQRRAPKKKPSSAQQQPGPRAGELGQEEMKKLEQRQKKQRKQQDNLEQGQQNHLEQRDKQQNDLEQNYLEQRQKKQRKQQNHLEQRQQQKLEQLEQRQKKLEQRQQKKLKRLERRQKKKQQNYLEQNYLKQRQQNHLEQRQKKRDTHLEQRQKKRDTHLEQNHLEQRQQKRDTHLEQNHLEQTPLEQRQKKQQNSLEQRQTDPEQRQPCLAAPSPCLAAPSPCLAAPSPCLAAPLPSKKPRAPVRAAVAPEPCRARRRSKPAAAPGSAGNGQRTGAALRRESRGSASSGL